jgi:intracellular septation protein A
MNPIEDPPVVRAEPATGGGESIELSEPLDARAIVRRSAPRVLRDGLGPLVSFFIVWKLTGLVVVGIAAATAFAAAVYRHERRLGRPALIVRVAFVLVMIRAVVGLSSGSARVYLGQEAVIDAMLGITVLWSLRFRRPLAAAFAREIYPFPDELRDSPTLMRVFRIVTVVWGVYFLCRSAVRLTAVLTLSVDQYALVLALSDAPFLLALLAWSVVYSIRAVRASPELATALAPASEPATP